MNLPTVFVLDTNKKIVFFVFLTKGDDISWLKEIFRIVHKVCSKEMLPSPCVLFSHMRVDKTNMDFICSLCPTSNDISPPQ